MKKNRVLLFFPELLANQRPLLVPLELLALTPSLKHQGLEVTILDERVESWSSETLRTALTDVLFVGISCRPGGQVGRSFIFADAIKSVFPEIPVVMGGWFPSIVPERVAAHPAIDYVITGEGEHPIARLADHLQNEIPVNGIPGVGFYRDHAFVYTPHERISRISEQLTPDYTIINLEPYLGEQRDLSYISSKGCDASCRFCAITCGYDRQWFPIPADRVIHDIRELVSFYQLKSIRFVDANFFCQEARVVEICKGLLDQSIKIRWRGAGRADQLLMFSDHTWEMIRASGCYEIEIGAESGSSEILREMDKGIELSQVESFVKKAAHHGIRVTLNYILGYPGERTAELWATTQAIHQFKQRFSNVNFAIYRFSPIPETVICSKLEDPTDWKSDPRLVEKSMIYRISGSQEWLDTETAHISNMLFYCYLPFSLRAMEGQQDRSFRGMFRAMLHKLAFYRVCHFRFQFPFEWWILRFGTRIGLFNRQRFRQWVCS